MKLKWNSAWKSHTMARERPHKCDHTLNVVVTKLVTKKWSYYRYIYTYISQKLIGLNWIFFYFDWPTGVGFKTDLRDDGFETDDTKLPTHQHTWTVFAAEFKSAISISVTPDFRDMPLLCKTIISTIHKYDLGPQRSRQGRSHGGKAFRGQPLLSGRAAFINIIVYKISTIIGQEYGVPCMSWNLR